MNQTPDIASSPPGPARPHVLDCDQHTFDLLPRLVERYGEIVRVRAPNLARPAWVLANPASGPSACCPG